MKNSNDPGLMLGAVLMGAAIGGVLGILFAPDKGSETRRKIAGRSDDLTTAMKDNIMKGAQAVKNTAAELMETEKDLNDKIMKITMKINDKYPELTKYIDEMSATIPDVQNPEINIKYLRTYYESLNTMLQNYIVDHPNAKA